MGLIALTIGASIGIAARTGVSRLAEYRTTPASVADLLNWAFLVDDGVVL